ncbi:hypothetical protein BJF78_36120 [Pseudonocardia sp. CNS-139]|nr:hypothetical protein BJF78_36120 [Pseudonocardia sp. CNS-139]
MTDGQQHGGPPDEPQVCALPGCSVPVEQPEDGGPPRLYCSPAHRAAARKQRHTARMEATGAAAAAAVSTEEPTTPVADPAEWMASPVSSGGAAATESGTRAKPRTIRPVKPEKPARTRGERRTLAALLRRRTVAGIAIASLVAGGSGYVITEAVTPLVPPQPPPSVDPQTAAMEADVWAGRAEVVLASINQQLDAVAQTEANWLRLPEHIRNQIPPAVRSMLERKALLEQQRATLMSQLAALRALPSLTTDLATAQAELDAVERALQAAPSTPSRPTRPRPSGCSPSSATCAASSATTTSRSSPTSATACRRRSTARCPRTTTARRRSFGRSWR